MKTMPSTHRLFRSTHWLASLATAACALALCLLLPTGARAANIAAAVNGNILTGTTWTGGQAPVSGDANTWQSFTNSLTAATAGGTFLGQTLEIQTNGSFKAGLANSTAFTLNNLVLDAGGLIAHANNLQWNLSLGGNTFTLNGGTITCNQGVATRSIGFANAVLAGSGTVTISQGVIGAGDLTFASSVTTTGFTGTFNVIAAGRLALPAITAANATFGLILTTNSSTITNSGKLDLTASIAVTSLNLLGNTIAPGVYKASDLQLLNVNYTNCFVNPASANTVTVDASLTYNGNGNTGGTVPSGSGPVAPSSPIPVAGPGSLVNGSLTFTGWNTAANGTGTAYVYNSSSSTFSPSSITLNTNTTLYAQWQNVGATITTSTTGPLSDVSTTYGTASTSPATFTVSGTTITSPGIAVVAPAGYEVSQSSGSGYGSTTTVTGSGTIPTTTIYVRLAATTPAGAYAGNVICTNASAVSVYVATSGTDAVSQYALTLTGAVVASKFQDGTTNATFTTAGTLSATVNGDVITPVAYFPQSSVGTGLSVILVPTGTHASSYTITASPSTLTADIYNAVWANAVGGNWSTSGNWVNNLVGTGANITADFSQVDITANTAVHVDTARTIGSLIFGNTDGSPAANWIVDNNGNSANILTLAGTTTTPTITVDSTMGTGEVIIGTVIAGSSGLTMAGAGTLVLTNANTYTGGTTIGGGLLMVANSGTLGNSTNALTLSGGTLDLGNLTTPTVGVVSITAAASGNTVQNGTLTVGSVAASLTSGTATIAANLAGNGGVTMSGVGGTLTFTGNNAYTNVTTVTSGTLAINGNNSAATGGLSIGNNSPASTLDIGSSGIVVVPSSAVFQLGNTTTAAGTGPTATIDGTVTNYGALNVGRAATLTLDSGANWYQTGPVLDFPNGAAAFNNFINVNSGATFTYNNGSTTFKMNGLNNNSSVAKLTVGGTFTTSAGFEQTTTPSTGYAWLNLNGGTLNLSASVPTLCIGGTNTSGVSIKVSTAGNSTIDTANFSTTITNAIADGASAGSLTKLGSGTLTLSGVNTYSSGTTVNNGKLVGVTGGSVASDVSVEATSGNTAVLGVAITDTTKTWTCPNLTVDNSALGGNSCGLDFNFGSLTPSTTQAPLTVSGNVNFNSIQTVSIEASGLALTGSGNGYPLMTWGGSTGPSSVSGITLSLPVRVAGNLFISGSTLYLQITTAANEPLIWQPGTGTWNTTSTFWKDSIGTIASYTDGSPGDAVVFDNTGGGGTVTLTNTFTPAAVAVSNANYTITGSGTIAGSGGVTKGGTGTLTLATTNTYTGTTAVNGGKLQISTVNNLGTGPISLGGGTLDSTANSYDLGSNRSVTLTASSTLQADAGNIIVSGVISGGYNLSKTGNGALTLAGANTFGNGSTTFDLAGGTLNLNNNNALGVATNTFEIEGGTTIDNTSGAAITLANTNPIVINGSFTFTGSTNLTTGAGTINLSNLNNTITVGGNPTNVALTLAGPISNGGIIKNGDGRLAFTSTANSYAGGLVIKNGVVNVTGQPNILGSTAISVTLGDATTDANGAALLCATYTYTNPITVVGGGNGPLLLANQSTAATPNFFGAITLSGNPTLKVATSSMLGLETSRSTTVSGGITGTGSLVLDNSGTNSTLQITNAAVNCVGSLTVQGTGGGVTTISSVIGANVTGVTQNSSSSKLTLAGVNTYTGNTVINAGILALASTGSINSSANLIIAAGATNDVSAYSTYNLSGSTTLKAAGNTSPAVIVGGSSVNLGASPIILTYDGSHPALNLASGALALSGNAITVTVPGTALPPSGTPYILIATPTAITGSVNPTPILGGNGLASGATGVVSISGNNVILTVSSVVTSVPTTTTLVSSANPSAYGQNVTFTATIAPASGSVVPTGSVQFKTNGVALGTPVTVTAGTSPNGMAATSLASLPASTYAVTAEFTGTGNFLNSTNSPTLSQLVNPTVPTLTLQASGITYGQTLASSSLTGSAATNGQNNAAVAGTFTFANSAIAPSVGSTNVTVNFTPSDAVNYSATSGTVNVLVAARTNAYLTALTITPAGAFSFASNTISYTTTNAYANNPVTINATSSDTNATLQLSFNGGSFTVPVTNSLSVGSQTLNLTPSPLNTVAVKVTAQDGITTNLYTVNVLLQPSLTAFKVTNSVVGGTNLVLNWPVDHTGYQLLTQTNNLNKGVSKNTNDWGTLGYTTTNAAVIPITKTNLNSYYRLVYP